MLAFSTFVSQMLEGKNNAFEQRKTSRKKAFFLLSFSENLNQFHLFQRAFIFESPFFSPNFYESQIRTPR
jgi:hypothetical protein